ncbi:ATP-binding cassette domain-containing protein [Bacillus nakamurai]|uniref:ABC transporter domain-containing protein n=1 Tax=Bacillus nakamurai TaxID=1793963 RepID=A0A150F6I3_9BACI|nr:ATP-binding cassette domain-containing protein [Bacillus nakamurai]KXZ17032.1 hypothetical protein AXI58_01145 [Bacillus nakamurai]MED1229025.1 ATP-binding cassette domain-containing protein [Bacillus nakamurai]
MGIFSIEGREKYEENLFDYPCLSDYERSVLTLRHSHVLTGGTAGLSLSLTYLTYSSRQAHLKDLVNNYPDGLNTVIGERGVKLSGGQKQRLSIARMFLKNPSILILDEATSALDTETEAAIQNSLQELSEGRTTLVIAHRLATIKHADRIIVVTKEGIAEEGSGGMYIRLHQAQFGEMALQ